jgi:hypothetical protein
MFSMAVLYFFLSVYRNGVADKPLTDFPEMTISTIA